MRQPVHQRHCVLCVLRLPPNTQRFTGGIAGRPQNSWGHHEANCLPSHHFLALEGATGGAAGPAAKLSFTDWGSLSALATNKLTCYICVLDNVFSKPGIPVMRMPPATFQ